MCEIGLSAIVTSGLPTDRQTLRDFARSRLRAPLTRARAGEARARPGVRGIMIFSLNPDSTKIFGNIGEEVFCRLQTCIPSCQKKLYSSETRIYGCYYARCTIIVILLWNTLMKMSFPTFNKIIRKINFQNIQARVLLLYVTVKVLHVITQGKSRGKRIS